MTDLLWMYFRGGLFLLKKFSGEENIEENFLGNKKQHSRNAVCVPSFEGFLSNQELIVFTYINQPAIQVQISMGDIFACLLIAKRELAIRTFQGKTFWNITYRG